jgi:hypothetical protein
MDQYDQQPEVRVTAEVGAAVTNLTFTDYHGYSYDRLGLELYRSLNFMQMGRLDDARTALRALQNRQIEAEDHFRKKIDALEIKNEPAATAVDPAPDAAAEPSEQTKQSIDVARTLNESGVDKKGKARPSVAQALAAEYGDDVVLVPDRSAYKAYSNPFGEYLQGIYFMAAGLNGSDTETASTAFKRVAGMLPDNPYVAQDLALAETVAAGSPVPPITYVFFETGQAPVRDSIRIDIPVFIVNVAYKDTGVDYVGAAFPKLKFVGGQTE